MVDIRLSGLSVCLAGRQVLSDLDLGFSGSGLVGVIGPNGAGKSTLARAILALVKPSAGAVLLDGVSTAAIPRDRLARSLSWLPQGQTLHWPLTVERLVGLGRLPHLTPVSRIGTADREAIARAMQRTDVSDLAARPATELSGGERARVLLARALAVEAPVLIADEPLAALDPGHQFEVMELLRREADDGRLVLAILHDLGMAARYCDRLVLLNGGELVADGRPLDVLDEKRLAEVYGIRARIDRSGPQPLVIPLSRAG